MMLLATTGQRLEISLLQSVRCSQPPYRYTPYPVRPAAGCYHDDMNGIRKGTVHEQPLLVTPEVAIDYLGGEDARVLSTPHMILWMEITARNCIKPLLAEGYDSVGVMVNVRHLAATPAGMAVRFVARVDAVDGNRVMFTVEAHDEKELIGLGTHERYIIHVPRFISRLAAKRESA
jgi:predicted thioesterase